MRASQPAARRAAAQPASQPPIAASQPVAAVNPPPPPQSSPSAFSSCIAGLDRRFTFSYPSLTPPGPPPPPFILHIRVEASPTPAFVLTATDISQFYQLRLDSTAFDAARASSMFVDASPQHLCDLLTAALTANTAASPRITHTLSASSSSLTLTFIISVAGARMAFPFTLPALMGRGLDDVGDGGDGGRAKRRKGAGEYADSLDFPDLDFLSPTSPPPPPDRFEAAVYQREMGRLLRALVGEVAEGGGGGVRGARMELEAANVQLRTELEAAREEMERLREVRGGAGGDGAGEAAGRGGRNGGKKASAVLKPTDRSLLNPNMKRRRQKGIKLGE